MTSHRRRRSETMPNSSKDKKRDSSCGKDKSDSQEGQKASLPLFKKSVYIDIKNGKQAEVIEGQLKKLGANIEKFLSREVNYVISSSAQPTKSEERSSNGDNPASPSCSVPSPFSSIPSPTPPSETKAAVVSRGKALAQIACSRSRASTVIANADKWGIKVVAVETASKWLEREMQKASKESEKNTTAKKEVPKKEVPKVKKKVVRRKKKTLKGCYIKFEAINLMYRPIKSELDKWPKLNVLAPPGLNPYCEVKMKMQNFLRRHSSLRNARGSVSASSGKACLKKTRSMSSVKESISFVTTTPQATADVVAVPITTTGDVKRHLGLVHRKRPDKLQGYCECCRIKYKDMNQHIKEDDHQAFARDKSNFESLDVLINQIPSTSQFLQDILLRHCVQKQKSEMVQNISNGAREVAAKLDIDVLPVISPLPSEATPNAAEGIAPSTKTYPKSPNISKDVCEHGSDNAEDTRPHAVVIRRRTPSGAFVSPRRREPTPSKRPWMQERFMVFRDSPMASLQPSEASKGLTCSINDTPLGSLSQSLNGTPLRNCDQLKSKSIVRSLIEMPDFISSSSSTSSETNRLSVKQTEEENSLSARQKCMERITSAKTESKQKNLDVDSEGSDLGSDISIKSASVNSQEWLGEIEGGVAIELQNFKDSPELFVPCIADRVKRRSRIFETEETKSENHDSSSISLVDATEIKDNQEIRRNSQEKLDPNENDNDPYPRDSEKLQSDPLQEGNVAKMRDISKEDRDDKNSESKKLKNRRRSKSREERNKRRSKKRFSNVSTSIPNLVDDVRDCVSSDECDMDVDPIVAIESDQDDSLAAVKEVSSTRTRKSRGSSKCAQPRNESEDKEIMEIAPTDMVDNLDRRNNSKVTPQSKKLKEQEIKKQSGKKDKSRCGKKDKRRSGKSDRRKREKRNAARKKSSVNVVGGVNSRVRKCRLFVHEGFYADKEEYDTMEEEFELSKEPRSGLKVREKQNGLNEESSRVDDDDSSDDDNETDNDDGVDDADGGNDDDVDNQNDTSVVDLGVEGDSNFEMKSNKITTLGKRIFRGKKFHTTKANWDLKTEDENDSSDDCEEKEPVRLSVGERVKNRRSCTLFNHKGQYANNGEGGDRNEVDADTDSKRECSSAPQSPHHMHSSELPTSAVVLRRLPLSRSGLTKNDRTWCKMMSKKDWTQNDSQVGQDEGLENNLSDEGGVSNSNLNSYSEFGSVSAHGQEHEATTTSTPCQKGFVTHTSHAVRSSGKTTSTSQKMMESGSEEFKSPEKGLSKYRYTDRKILKSSKLSLRKKGSRKSDHLKKFNGELDGDFVRSPRLKLKIVRDAGSDCYSSTLEELNDDNNVDSKNKWAPVEKNLLHSPYRLSNETSPTNHSSRLERSDSIDLLDTPRRGSNNSVKNHRLSHSPLSPQCRRDILAMKSPNSKIVRKKRKFSNSERELQSDKISVDRPLTAVNDSLHQKQLIEMHLDLEDDVPIIDKPPKRRKKSLSVGNAYDDCQVNVNDKASNDPHIDMKSPSKRNGTTNHLSSINSNHEASLSSSLNCESDRLKQTCSKQDIACDSVIPSLVVSADNGHTCKLDTKTNSKSNKKKRKRKLALSDEDTVQTDGGSSKKAKLDCVRNERVEEKASIMAVMCSPQKNIAYNMLMKTRPTPMIQDDASNDKLFSEPSFSNVGDLLHLVPNFSSPGKTNSSWDDACDSYISTSVKTNDQTPGKHDPSVNWSPLKRNSPAKSHNNNSANKKSLLSRSESEYKSGRHNSICSTLDGLSNVNSHSSCVTPTKRNNSQNYPASPSVQKVDSVISFNHMSPQRLHFSPIKFKSPVRNSEKSPVVQKIDSAASLHRMSPQRLTFSPSKKQSARKQL